MDAIERHILVKKSIGAVLMGNSIKKKLERSLAGNHKLNKKALQMQRSWKEVNAFLNKGKSKKNK